MSMVRMCDTCGTIYKEGEEGSATGTVTVMVKNHRGQVTPEQRAQDMCRVCAMGGSVQPRLPELQTRETVERAERLSPAEMERLQHSSEYGLKSEYPRTMIDRERE